MQSAPADLAGLRKEVGADVVSCSDRRHSRNLDF